MRSLLIRSFILTCVCLAAGPAWAGGFCYRPMPACVPPPCPSFVDREVVTWRPVYETHYREVRIVKYREVAETVMEERCIKTPRQVTEMVAQQVTETTYNRVEEVHEQEHCQTVMRPCVVERQVAHHSGYWTSACGIDYCGYPVLRPTFVPQVCLQTVQHTVLRPEVVRTRVPVTVCRLVPVATVREIQVPVCRTVIDEQTIQVPVVRCRLEAYECVEQVPYAAVRMVECRHVVRVPVGCVW